MLRRSRGIGLLLIANILIFIALSITFHVLAYFVLPAFGIDLRGSIAQMDLLWAFVIGFGGAFVSLAFSKRFARSMYNCQQITQPRTQAEQVIYGTVQDIVSGQCHSFCSTHGADFGVLRQTSPMDREREANCRQEAAAYNRRMAA